MTDDQAEHGVHLDVDEPDPGDGAQFVLVLGGGVGAERRPAGSQLEQPRMTLVKAPIVPGDAFQAGAPAARRLVVVDGAAGRLGADQIHHRIE
jgi:hypothetical protein